MVRKNPSTALPWLDLLRFLAAFAVLVSHARQMSFVEYGALPEDTHTVAVRLFFAMTRLGHESILIFFVLSGFLVGGKLLDRTQKGDFNVASYFLDRSVRLFVPLIPALLLTYIVGAVVSEPVSIFQFVGALLHVQGVLVDYPEANGSLWTLAYEGWFYILAGFAALTLMKSKRRSAYFIALIAALCVFTKLDPVYLFCWLIGAISFLGSDGRKFSRARFCSSIAIFTVSIFFIQTGKATVSLERIIPVPPIDVSRILFCTAACFMIQQLVLIVPTSTPAKFVNSMGTRLAAFSYTLYLVHYPVLVAFGYAGWARASTVNVTTVTQYFVQVLTCLAVAYAFYLPFERNTDAIKHWIKDRYFPLPKKPEAHAPAASHATEILK